jgi:hypothetical protein
MISIHFAHYFPVEELPENGATIAVQRNSGVKKNVNLWPSLDWHHPLFLLGGCWRWGQEGGGEFSRWGELNLNVDF